MPQAFRANGRIPLFEASAPTFQWLRKWASWILAKRVRHAFEEPVWLEKPSVETAEAFVLKVMNELVANEVWVPCARRDN